MPAQLSRRNFLKASATSIAIATASKGLTQTKAAITRNTRLSELQATSRFLTQATLGAPLELIEDVNNKGIEAWLNEQLELPHNSRMIERFWELIEEEELEPNLLPPLVFNWFYWNQIMKDPDVLRHRMAFALSEIFVISTVGSDEIMDAQFGLATYYDTLSKHALGNYRDLLFDVTMHPIMGQYLSHLKNRKSDPDKGRFPDENYAREVMQLFSIGLYELNIDGSYKLDVKGEPIPTYGNNEITEFARIFTGLSFAHAPQFDFEDIEEAEEYYNFHEPMKMFDSEHEQGEKHLLNGFVVPAGQSGMEDIYAALDNIFHHPNVGPFIGRLLIQRLVTSNPSNGYVARVAQTFNNNGKGVRGDLGAVVKAILLDEEARNLKRLNDPTWGMLREPFVRYTQLMRSFQAFSDTDEYYVDGYETIELLKQYPFHAPSVFNFFSPNYQPPGALKNVNLVAPEFQIMTAVTAISTINLWENTLFRDTAVEISPPQCEPIDEDENGDEIIDEAACERAYDENAIYFNFDHEYDLAHFPEELLEHLDLVLTYGTLSPKTKQIILDAITPLDDVEDRVRMAVYLMMISPEYAVLT